MLINYTFNMYMHFQNEMSGHLIKVYNVILYVKTILLDVTTVICKSIAPPLSQ